ncbi:MAG: DUF3784 domain-containing protein [Dyadobacter sp.]|uniref:DUF3784 domain-containing protein n=1 Tax=Dyadobacter sp. TaxID=1914288 RepID=UPI001B2BFC4A|nr:DUF3784 domain-containing protein [Dyadobacter sp.]MBO9615944.1 DUF3784 domain-containing protein [Dyadobacter sp.]
MLTVAIIISLVLFSLGFIVTPGNAKYLLSGYNTMSEADRAKMDIVSYVKFFKRFHIFLGISELAGVLILNAINTNLASGFMIMYPLLAYVYMIAVGNRYYTGTSGQRVGTYIVMAILIVVVVGVGYLMFTGMKNSEIFLTTRTLEIKGLSGMKIAREDVTDFTVTDSLPDISSKANGFAAGEFAKGAFKTDDGRIVRLYINKKSHPFLLIRTVGDEIYFSSDAVSATELYNQLKAWKSR